MYAFIVTFGIGYLMVGRDISQNRGIVVLGIIGKTLFFAACSSAYFSGVVNAMVLLTGIIDMIFVFLFAEFLVTSARHQ